jgi:hypothetical protein
MDCATRLYLSPNPLLPQGNNPAIKFFSTHKAGQPDAVRWGFIKFWEKVLTNLFLGNKIAEINWQG